MKGKGLTRNPTSNPPQVRAFLATHGTEKVTTIKLVRVPLTIRKIADVLTGNKIAEALKKAEVDEVFHLAMLLNGKYILEKNAVISLKAGSFPSNAESVSVPVTKTVTIDELLMNTQKRMGSSYGTYNLRSNNCSDFLSNVLYANGLSTPEAQKFLKQEAGTILKNLPSIYEKVIDIVTKTQAVIDRVVEGEGAGTRGRGFTRPTPPLPTRSSPPPYPQFAHSWR